MSDINRVFEDIALYEDKASKSGFDLGYREGLLCGREEGRRLGFTKGMELGCEIGEINGFISMCKTQHMVFSDLQKPRVKKLIQDLEALIAKFPRENTKDMNFAESLMLIRARFKQLQSLLHIGTQHDAMEELSF